MKIKTTLILLAAAVLVCGLCASTNAQSTVMNAPSTDVVSAKKVYLEMDFITNYAWAQGDERFANYLPRAVVGVGNHIEVGANVSYTRVPGGGEPLELQPNAKWQFYNNEEKGLAAAAGCMWFIPVTHRSGTDTFGQCYSTASKRFKGDYGPRFTGGAYTLIAARKDLGTRTGAIAAYEQPLSDRLAFIVDWQSGNNRFGYISPAVNVTVPRNGNLSAGYAIANQGRGRNWFFLFYGQQF
jgi:hypothetical protein